jgi:hypothetical protein
MYRLLAMLEINWFDNQSTTRLGHVPMWRSRLMRLISGLSYCQLRMEELLKHPAGLGSETASQVLSCKIFIDFALTLSCPTYVADLTANFSLLRAEGF